MRSSGQVWEMFQLLYLLENYQKTRGVLEGTIPGQFGEIQTKETLQLKKIEVRTAEKSRGHFINSI